MILWRNDDSLGWAQKMLLLASLDAARPGVNNLPVVGRIADLL
jgi:hypothetical protein